MIFWKNFKFSFFYVSINKKSAWGKTRKNTKYKILLINGYINYVPDGMSIYQTGSYLSKIALPKKLGSQPFDFGPKGPLVKFFYPDMKTEIATSDRFLLSDFA